MTVKHRARGALVVAALAMMGALAGCSAESSAYCDAVGETSGPMTSTIEAVRDAPLPTLATIPSALDDEPADPTTTASTIDVDEAQAQVLVALNKRLDAAPDEIRDELRTVIAMFGDGERPSDAQAKAAVITLGDYSQRECGSNDWSTLGA